MIWVDGGVPIILEHVDAWVRQLRPPGSLPFNAPNGLLNGAAVLGDESAGLRPVDRAGLGGWGATLVERSERMLSAI